MTIIISGLITLHVACQKILGLWPTMNSMSLLNLLESNERETQSHTLQACLDLWPHMLPATLHCDHLTHVLFLQCKTVSFFTHFYDLPSHVFTAVISSRIETQLFSTSLPCYVIINTLASLSWLTHYLYMCVPRLLPSLSLQQQQLRQCMNNSKITAEGFYDLAKTPSKLHSWAIRRCAGGGSLRSLGVHWKGLCSLCMYSIFVIKRDEKKFPIQKKTKNRKTSFTLVLTCRYHRRKWRKPFHRSQ